MSVLTEEDLLIIVSRATDSSFKIVSHKLEPFNKGNAGFLGSHSLLSINVKISGEVSTRTFFLKTAPKNNLTKDGSLEAQSIEEEIHFYSKINPLLLADYNDVKWSPMCYLAKPGILVIEDLRCQGFATSCETIINPAELKSAISSVARFHACSILVEAKLGKTLKEEFPGFLKEKMFDRSAEIWKINEVNYKTITQMAKEFKLDTTNLSRVFDLTYECVKPNEKLINVVSHGDLHKINMLFRNSELTNCVLVDFQLLRYTSFACDLNALIYLNTTPELRKESEVALFDVYYSIFREILLTSDIPVNIPTRERMLKEYIQMNAVGVTYSALYLHGLYLKPEVLDELYTDVQFLDKWLYQDRYEIVKSQLESDPIYFERMKSILKELTDYANSVFSDAK